MSSGTIEKACHLIAAGDLAEASRVIATEYPFDPPQHAGRHYTPRIMTRIFMRDGFIDRYRGNRLVFPPVLRLLSHYLPSEFPYHRNWKMSEVHRAYWELYPTIDHVVPVARGGGDCEENWVSCSMHTNSIKSNWTLEDLNWELLPSGRLANWDGLMTWFMQQAAADPAVLGTAYLRSWHAAARAARNDQPGDRSP
ncbi:MAG: HNH endonuclease [Acidiferrobacterales bacterium]